MSTHALALIGHPGAADLQAQQVLLDEFQQHYNHERPHESLEQKLPCDFYQHSIRKYPEKLMETEYPRHFVRARVC
ncbi:MAG: integrase core domain-containing protein, partial [Polaromonas sp.]|nr:integrase core domain-containing protein [Polaromonas sp.]